MIHLRFPPSLAWSVALGAALAGCTATTRDPGLGPVAPLRVEGDGYRGVILPADAAEDTAEADEGTWVPTAADVRAAEGLLAAYVRKEAAEYAPDLWRRLPGYHRQYLGTMREGRRCIYINLVRRACWEEDVGDGFDGDRCLLVVLDGGDAYLQAEFDVEAGEFLWFGVNGEA